MTDVTLLASRRRVLTAMLVVVVALTSDVNGADKEYYGKHLGKLKQLHHGVSGDVYAVDARTLHIRDFNYDGEGPAAYFYVGSSKVPSGSGTRINDEKGTTNVLPRYRNKHITLTLPEGKTLNTIKWFSVWCDEFSVNFGDVKIPKGFAFPKPQKLEALKGIHGVSSENVVIVDAQTLLIPNFSYDGEAPDAKFWVGSGSKPTPQGLRIPDENGKVDHPLRRYDQKTIVLTLPSDMTIFDIGHFGVWCEAFAVDFGHVKIPKGANVPPSLKMLGVSPQKHPRSLQLHFEQSRYQQLPYQPVESRQRYEVNQYYQATTYKPAYQLAHLQARSEPNFQIIPSVAVQPNQHAYFGQPLYNNEYEIIQPYQSQQSNVYVNNEQPRYVVQQPHYEAPRLGEVQGKSFSRVSINGAGGHSNTYIQY